VTAALLVGSFDDDRSIAIERAMSYIVKSGRLVLSGVQRKQIGTFQV
jgi:hypothetical protein